MQLANIPSKNPFYVTKSGLIFNDKGCLMVGTLVKRYNLRVLNYKALNGSFKQTAFTKIVFTTFHPEIPLDNCKIMRLEIKDDYNLSNLKCVNNRKVPKYIGIQTEEYFKNLKREGISFYEHLTLLQRNTFINLLKTRKHTIKFLASKYGVSEMAIYRAKRKLKLTSLI